MMKNFRILDRVKFRGGPVTVLPGDSLAVTYQGARLVSHRIQEGEAGTYDEAAIFEGLLEGRRVIGGLIVEQEAARRPSTVSK